MRMRSDYSQALVSERTTWSPGARPSRISIAVTDEFLRALRGNLRHYVVDPHTGRKTVLREKQRNAEGDIVGVDVRMKIYDSAVGRRSLLLPMVG